MCRKLILLISFVLVLDLAGNVTGQIATEYYVAPYGDDSNLGTLMRPFRTIQKAANVMGPGDTCYIREGRYHEEVVINNLNGTEEAPITFRAYPGETATLDGTIPITSNWTLHDGHIYKTTLTKDIWQLFTDGKMMTSARWPNAEAWSDDMWNLEKTWGHQHENSTYGHMIDDGTLNLAGTGVDFTGAIAILNVGSWQTFAEKVISHGVGSSSFTYTTHFPEKHFRKVWQGRYFFESSLVCLDATNEWFFDKETKTLYLYPDDGKNPTGRKIAGKTTTYALELKESSFIRILNLNFFSSTINFQNTDHTRLENCNFQYPSYSKRMLGILDKPEPTIIYDKTENPSENIIRNCVFEKADGSGLKIAGKNDLVENCYFHFIDYSCVGTTQDVLINASEADGIVFRRNTFDTGGNSVGVKLGKGSTVELNRVTRSGLLQHDGSAIQGSTEKVEGTVIRKNWVYNSAKSGIRFDSPWLRPSIYGRHGKIVRNVVWNTRRIQAKGDDHYVYNNTAFDNEQADLSIFSVIEHGGVNKNTITRNNAVNVLSGSNSGQIIPIYGIHSHNWVGMDLKENIKDQLRDPDNWDFRPKAGSDLIDAGYEIPGITDGYLGSAPDIGAYEYGDPNYWIPGYQTAKAQVLIPPDKSTLTSTQVDFIWLGGYQGISYDIYLGTDYLAVANADHNSPEFKGNQTNNIYTASGLDLSTTYYWRIDTVKADETVVGDVWSFTVVVMADPLAEALDTDLSFTTGGSSTWFGQTTTSYHDGDAAQSGDISHSEDSWMQTTVSGTGTVKFYWKVSSEEDCDYLKFYIDGSSRGMISGSVDWQQETYTIITSGPHVLEWRYHKDASVDSDSDCGWVDKVEWVTN